MPKNIFSIEHQYQLFLQRIALSEEQMGSQQRILLRMTFFGAAGQLLVLMRDDLSRLEENHGVRVLEDMHDQVMQYFESISAPEQKQN